MHIYICLETLLNNKGLIPNIKEYYQLGHHITIATTQLFRNSHARKDIENMLELLKGSYHVLSFLKPSYDKIIDDKALTAPISSTSIMKN